MREKLYAGKYGEHKRPYVIVWLQEQEVARRAISDAEIAASNSRHLSVATSAKNAAWAAAIAAIISVIAAAVMFYLSQFRAS